MSATANAAMNATVSPATNAATGPAVNAATGPRTARDRRSPSTAEADNLAVASFLLGLPGLLLFNIVLGPLAITLGTLALVRGTHRRGRAVLGLALGVAALAILAVTTAGGHGVLWQIGD
ncbi:DUF4190 domain-containing protein [Kitasatospora sp. NPDC058170]|uniref:DUF4190 domain-containing protein n=1 Tax=Kitasatospora sp. NPDC058170 TaxID=3346364 RepID=UPI0036DBA197